jgi:hypothetical protein
MGGPMKPMQAAPFAEPRAAARAVALNLAGAALLLLAVAGFTWWYTQAERTFHFWDSFGYQAIAHGFYDQVRREPGALGSAVWQSLGSDHNAVFAVAILPFFAVLGDNRMAYVLGLSVCYLFPFLLAVGGLAAALLPRRRVAAFWSGALAALLTPFTWVPSLRGLPDIGGEALALFAFLAYLRDVRLGKWWQAPLIGLLLALAMLFRRQFAYSATAFFLCAGLLAALAWLAARRRGEPRPGRQLAVQAARLALTGGCMLAALLVMGAPFVQRALTLDAFGLYASWFLSAFTIVEYQVLAYGILASGIALAALAHGARTRELDRATAGFALLFTAVALAQWTFYIRTTASPFTLHFTPFIALGLAAAFWLAWDRAGRSRSASRNRAARGLVAAASGIFLAANVVLGLTGLDFLKGSLVRPLFAANWPPVVREDYDELARLAKTLREINPDGRPVFVAASSATLNRVLLYNAERVLFGWDAPTALQNVPEVDSRDYYPLEALLRAEYVAVAEPFQHHLPVEEQGIMQSVVDLFAQNRDLARDFTRLPEAFTLRDGVVVSVYRRIRPTDLDAATRAFHFIRSRAGRQPGGQLDWLSLVPGWPAVVQGQPGGPHEVVIGPATGVAPGLPALMHAPVVASQVRASGRLAALGEGCPLPGLRLTATGPVGAALASTAVPSEALAASGGAFDAAVEAGQAQGLRLELAPAEGGAACRYQLSGLRVH